MTMTTAVVVPRSPCRSFYHRRTFSSSLWMIVMAATTVTAFQSTQSPLTQRRQATTTTASSQLDNSLKSKRSIDEDSKLLLSRKNGNANEQDPRRRRRCSPCESNTILDDNEDLDRREAAFAMLGTLWAVTTGVATSSRIFPTAAANAAYGVEAKIKLPNPLENIILRTDQGCLVESLGNRECLVYGTSDDKIYQGANGQVLVQRLQQSVVALSSIPDLIQSKKWLAIQGVLTGPLGTLIATMNQLLQVQRDAQPQPTASVKAAEQLALKVKQDIFAISAAADRKQGDQALQSVQQATSDLVAFLKALE